MAIHRSKFKFVNFSKKQKQVLTWWTPSSPHADKDAIIADGAVRSGKTIIMSLSFLIWAMDTFDGANFGMAGKTISSFKRNVWFYLKTMAKSRGYSIRKLPEIGDNVFVISKYDKATGTTKENYFYIFGGKDERSQDLVQGFTAAGFFFDETAIMPQSFVDQCVARCSVAGAKLWFNCNPDGPFHWFKTEWIDKLDEKHAIRVHFLLDDNPSLDEMTIARYKRMFGGIFYERFILGLWVLAEGVIYSMFDKSMVVDKLPADVLILKKWIGIDYGQSNATVYLLVGQGTDDKLYILDEYYHEGRSALVQKSPASYAKEYAAWKVKNGVEGVPVNIEHAFVDPSAKGFMLQLHEAGERKLRQADNTVVKGIELVSSVIESDMFRVLKQCRNTIAELSAYRWDHKAQERGEDKPIKQNDHAMDALRYVVLGTRLLWQRLVVKNAA